MYTDDVLSAAKSLNDAKKLLNVPGWVVTLFAGFVAERNCVETVQAEHDIRERMREKVIA